MAQKNRKIKAGKKIIVAVIFLILLLAIIIAMPKTPKSSVVSGEDIAKASLKNNYGEKGIYAGQHQFKDYWARDSFFASFGALSIGDKEIVKKNLELFLEGQKNDGQLPLRVGQKDFYILKLAGFQLGQEVPVYNEDKNSNIPLDQNCLAIIIAEHYTNKTNDIEFARNNFKRLENAFLWLEKKDADKNFLVEEDAYGGWTDSIKKKGEVLYSNVCFYKAAESLGKIQEYIGLNNTYSEKAEKINESINRIFWNGNYYDDFIFQGENFEYFSSDGNLLAVLWGIASNNHSEKILQSTNSFGIRSEKGILNTNKQYPKTMKSPELAFVDLSDYHDSLYWLWLSGLDAAVLKKSGHPEQAEKVLANMEKAFKKYGTVFEVYEKNGEPVQRLFYKAEHPFAWSAGMYLYAKDYGE